MGNVPVFTLQPNLGGLLSLLVTVFLPILVGLVTTRVTSAGRKALLLLFLASVTSFIETWISSQQAGLPFAWAPIVFNAVVNFGVAVAVHYGLWKPTGAATAAQNTGVTGR